ncbi:MAG TPA: class I SAM-dependent methyltransferase [Burkholderiales bacterium]
MLRRACRGGILLAPEQAKEVWAAGALYEPYVGRWSRLVARDFIEWLAVPRDAEWLDVGCGTGALSAAVLLDAAPRSLYAIDASAGFIAHARAQLPDARASFVVADAQTLPFGSASRDAVVSGLVLNFLPDPVQAVAETMRVLRPGGVCAAYVWDYTGKMEMMRLFWDAAVALDPRALALDEGRRFPLCRAQALGDLYVGAGLRGVEVRAIDVPTRLRDFDDYWSPFLGGQGPAPGYVVSLGLAQRERLRDCLRARLPLADDGAIALSARAWAVRGYAH